MTASTICAGEACFSSVNTSATFVSLIGSSALISSIVVVDELSTSSGSIFWILVSGDGCDVGGVVSSGRVGSVV